MLTFTDQPPQVIEIPRLEDHLIDVLFYQEDEIGEMRHTAFMIECGLEEDPPDGPDVPPIPWRPEQLREMAAKGVSTTSDKFSRSTRTPPSRTLSADNIDGIDEHLETPSRREPRRKLVAANSGTLRGMRKEFQKSHSADSIEGEIEKSPSTREERTTAATRKPLKLVKAKSGSLHGLRDAARKILEADGAPEEKSPVRRKLVATKSGTLHGMRKPLAPSTLSDSPPKSPVRKLTVTKSGTLHGMRNAIQQKQGTEIGDTSPARPVRRAPRSTNQKRTISSDGRTSLSSDSSDSNLGCFDSDGDSVVSIDTDEDVPKSPIKSPATNKTASSSFALRLKKTEKGSQERPSKELDTAVLSESKSRTRVFKNGKLVSDDGPPISPPNHSNATGPKVNPSIEKFRNGASVSSLLAEARAQRAKTSVNVSDIPPAFRPSSGK